MNKEQKAQYIEDLAIDISKSGVFYLADTSGLTVEKVNALRRKCFQNNIQIRVVKNTLLEKAMDRIEGADFSELKGVLSGPTAIMFAETGSGPAKLIKSFREKSPIPAVKAAYIEESVYVGDNNIDFLINIKGKNELIGDLVALLQSPAKNVISGLKSSGAKIAGILKTLSEKEN
jgi:large subunit ribosomal protein L10